MVEVADRSDLAHAVPPTGTELQARRQARPCAGVEPKCAGGALTGDDVLVTVPVEVAETRDRAHGVPASPDPRAAAEPGPVARVEVEQAGRGIPGDQVRPAVASEVPELGGGQGGHIELVPVNGQGLAAVGFGEDGRRRGGRGPVLLDATVPPVAVEKGHGKGPVQHGGHAVVPGEPQVVRAHVRR